MTYICIDLGLYQDEIEYYLWKDSDCLFVVHRISLLSCCSCVLVMTSLTSSTFSLWNKLLSCQHHAISLAGAIASKVKHWEHTDEKTQIQTPGPWHISVNKGYNHYYYHFIVYWYFSQVATRWSVPIISMNWLRILNHTEITWLQIWKCELFTFITY